MNRPIAGKTGTTEDFQDAWFAGFTPHLVTVVWVGFDTPSTLGRNQAGAVVAAPIWHQFMATALKDRPALPFVQPPGVTMAAWDSGSGMVTDAFKPDQVPGASGRDPPRRGRTGSASAAAPGAAAPAATASAPTGPGGRRQHAGRAVLTRAPRHQPIEPSHVRRIRRPQRADQAVRRAAEEASLTGMSPKPASRS